MAKLQDSAKLQTEADLEKVNQTLNQHQQHLHAHEDDVANELKAMSRKMIK